MLRSSHCHLYFDMDYVAAKSPGVLSTTFLDHGRLPSIAFKAFTKQLGCHPKLKCFRILCLLTPKWSFNVAVVARLRKNHNDFSILDQRY